MWQEGDGQQPIDVGCFKHKVDSGVCAAALLLLSYDILSTSKQTKLFYDLACYKGCVSIEQHVTFFVGV
jgi:hypothetical protein